MLTVTSTVSTTMMSSTSTPSTLPNVQGKIRSLNREQYRRIECTEDQCFRVTTIHHRFMIQQVSSLEAVTPPGNNRNNTILKISRGWWLIDNLRYDYLCVFYPVDCKKPLGLEDGDIKDSQLSADSYRSYMWISRLSGTYNMKAKHGRLNNKLAWCGYAHSYFQVNILQSISGRFSKRSSQVCFDYS